LQVFKIQSSESMLKRRETKNIDNRRRKLKKLLRRQFSNQPPAMLQSLIREIQKMQSSEHAVHDDERALNKENNCDLMNIMQ
jgi:hypothetical protein